MVAVAEKLALRGGPKAITADQKEASAWPIVEAEEIEAAVRVIQSGRWSTGPESRALEQEFAAYHGVDYALTFCNGSTALQTCYFALGVEPGDEVIVPAETFFTTATAVLNVGGIPIFADIDPETMVIDPKDIARKITPRTKVITVMHNNGMPADMDAVMALVREHDLLLLEDGSHAHGARYRGQRIGTFGHMAAFSLQQSKLCPSGEGGILITGDRALWRRAVAYGHYELLGGRPALSSDYGEKATSEDSEFKRFFETALGNKHRISQVSAALGRTALAKLDARNARRNAGVAYLVRHLSEIPGIHPLPLPDYVERVYFQGPRMRYDAAELGGLPIATFLDALRAEGANVKGGPEVSVRHHGGLHVQPLFTERAHWAFKHPANAASLARDPYGPGHLPNTEHPPLDRFQLPAFPRPTPELLDQYVAAFRKVAQSASELM